MNGNDDVRVVWGINRWVLVEAPNGAVQRQLSSASELADLFVDAGIPEGRAHELALDHWRERPKNAESASMRPGEAAWRATGFSRVGTLLILLAAVGLYALWILARP
jgi:hypothetical protein